MRYHIPLITALAALGVLLGVIVGTYYGWSVPQMSLYTNDYGCQQLGCFGNCSMNRTVNVCNYTRVTYVPSLGKNITYPFYDNIVNCPTQSVITCSYKNDAPNGTFQEKKYIPIESILFIAIFGIIYIIVFAIIIRAQVYKIKYKEYLEKQNTSNVNL